MFILVNDLRFSYITAFHFLINVAKQQICTKGMLKFLIIDTSFVYKYNKLYSNNIIQ